MSEDCEDCKLSDEEKKRLSRIQEIVSEAAKIKKVNRKNVRKVMGEILGDFNKVIDVVLYNCNEMERAVIGEVLVEILLIRMTLSGYLMAGVVDFIHQQLVTQPLASSRLLMGKEFIDHMVSNIKGVRYIKDISYIR